MSFQHIWLFLYIVSNILGEQKYLSEKFLTHYLKWDQQTSLFASLYDLSQLLVFVMKWVIKYIVSYDAWIMLDEYLIRMDGQDGN